MRKPACPNWLLRPATGNGSSITRHGRPAVELIRCDRGGGIDFEKLQAARRRLGIEGDGEGWPEEFNDPAFSRQVLGPDADQE